MTLNCNGFLNIGNTCYLNACLQLLFNIPQVTEYFNSKSFIDEINQNFKNNKFKKNKEFLFIQQFYTLLKDYTQHNKKIFTPKNLLISVLQINPIFRLHEQHDSQEILLYMIDTLHENLKYDASVTFDGKSQNKTDVFVIESIQALSSILNNKYSIVQKLFYGMYYNEFLSTEKSNYNEVISKKFEHFNNLTVQFEGDNLEENLHIFFQNEKMDCKIEYEKNKKKYYTQKTTQLVNMPPFLFITLKKYNFEKKKNNLNYTFPLHNLDLSQYCAGYDIFGCNYDLNGAICHEGSIDFGHYYCILKKDQKWYIINDDVINLFNMDRNKKLLFQNAYVLLYSKK